MRWTAWSYRGHTGHLKKSGCQALWAPLLMRAGKVWTRSRGLQEQAFSQDKFRSMKFFFYEVYSQVFVFNTHDFTLKYTLKHPCRKICDRSWIIITSSLKLFKYLGTSIHTTSWKWLETEIGVQSFIVWETVQCGCGDYECCDELVLTFNELTPHK